MQLYGIITAYHIVSLNYLLLYNLFQYKKSLRDKFHSRLRIGKQRAFSVFSPFFHFFNARHISTLNANEFKRQKFSYIHTLLFCRIVEFHSLNTYLEWEISMTSIGQKCSHLKLFCQWVYLSCMAKTRNTIIWYLHIYSRTLYFPVTNYLTRKYVKQTINYKISGGNF